MPPHSSGPRGPSTPGKRPTRPSRPKPPARSGGARDDARTEKSARGRPSEKPAPKRDRAPSPAPRRSSADAPRQSGASRTTGKAVIVASREDGLHRIAKLLARAGVASRRDIERMIEEGRIALNGQPVATPATLLADLSGVSVDGKPVAAPEPTRLFLFHKPSGVLTAERDFSGRPTIYSCLPEGLPRLMPVGRLDLNTEGLLLLTNDGTLKRALELPSTGIERTYRARAFGLVTQAMLEELAEGVTIEGVRYGRIDANLERSAGRNKWIELTLTEGKNREVRRVLEYLGLQVSRLIRVRYGRFVLGQSAPRDIEEVPDGEVAILRRSLKL